MWFKKVKVVKEPYEYNKNVPFDVAFKALREGYIIKHSNSDSCLKLMNNRIYQMYNRQDYNCYEVGEFSVFDMMIEKWQILEPNSVRSKK